ncbi:MYB-transcription factor 156 [Zea mays]|uniref:MYB-transcription factor 156 n=1 Tax=Zea mays TaxID=4577 RepID=A0A1D6K458_MAIZE|nr:MYB-transcription factor 156 [Zea mays]
MAKQSCCHKKKLRRGLWSPEEDEKLMNHIAKPRQVWQELQAEVDKLPEARPQEGHILARGGGPHHTPPLLAGKQVPPPSFEGGPMLESVKLAVELDWPVAGDGVTSRPCYLQGGCFDMDALQQHCGSIPPVPVVPSASASSSTLTSMAEAEHCSTNNVAAGGNLPWLELGANAVADAGGHVVGSCYAGALDELRWSEYFDSAFQAAESQQGALQPGQCVYGGKDDVPVHFDVHGGLSNWC